MDLQDRLLFYSFLQIKGISEQKEHAYWKNGICSLAQLDESFHTQQSLFHEESEAALNIRALERGDIDFFLERLDKKQYYRAAYSFPEDVMFLDIETTGLSTFYHYVTLVGWIVNGKYGYWLQGTDPKLFLDAFQSTKLIVTFNGKRFDCKFLDHTFQTNIFSRKPNLDLMHFCRRFKLTDGQKIIEKKVGFLRPEALEDMDGKEAIALWYDFLFGRKDSIERLILYNFYDILGMTYILDWLFFRNIYGQDFLKAGKPSPFYCKNIQLSKKKCVPSEKICKNVRAYVKKYISNFPRERLEPAASYRVAGIDLGGRTGLCLLTDSWAETRVAYTDEEIIRFIQETQPNLISIDAPLSLPKGRTSVYDDDPARSAGILRHCERELKRRGVNSYPALIRSMQELTKRGIRLAKQFRAEGYPVIECFPGAAQDVVQLPRKRTDESLLKQGLAEFGIDGAFRETSVCHDELDAITASLVGQFFISGYYEPLGIPEENNMIIPQKSYRSPAYGLVIGLAGPMATGKTEVGRYLERTGYRYIRYSQVIARDLSKSGHSATRSDLRQKGWDCYSGDGQYSLNKKLAEVIPACHRLVIDGMRHNEDFTFWKEREYLRFFLIYIDSEYEQCERRFMARGNDCVDYRAAVSHPVESHVKGLRNKADYVVENNGTREQLFEKIDAIVLKLEQEIDNGRADIVC